MQLWVYWLLPLCTSKSSTFKMKNKNISDPLDFPSLGKLFMPLNAVSVLFDSCHSQVVLHEHCYEHYKTLF